MQLVAWTVLVAIAAAVVAVLVRVRPRRQLIAPYAITLAITVAAYLWLPGEDREAGAVIGSFAVALVVGGVSGLRATTTGGLLGRMLFALLGAATPLLIVLAWLAVECPDSNCFS